MPTAPQPATPLEPLPKTENILPLLAGDEAEGTCCGGGSCSIG